MKLFVTIAEETPQAAVEAIRTLSAEHDGVEVRVERFPSFDPAMFRAATKKPLIVTRRGAPQDAKSVAAAIAAGIDLVDVEFGPGLGWVEPFRERVILSHHDFDGMPEVGPLLNQMRAHGCAQVKLAVTPHSLEENFELLAHQTKGTTLIGMGERGLFSRILAPFLGSELSFVSPSGGRAAAPGQITLERALAIFGDRRDSLRATHFFALAGNPAGHSLSPSIHN
ncbi:MAG: type I 3-dehydroquinate dehydratase, partial [Thermoanaerobaculia bacterium]